MNEREITHWDAMTGVQYRLHRVRRFPATPLGSFRAYTYCMKYNRSLREALGLKPHQTGLRLDDCMFGTVEESNTAGSAQMYRDGLMILEPVYRIPVTKDEDPMPVDYPHGF